MDTQKIIVWTTLVYLVFSTMPIGGQAQEVKELTKVNAEDILQQIQKGEDVNFEDIRIMGELNLSKIKLETIPNEYKYRKNNHIGLECELKVVKSNITIKDSFFEDDVIFSNTYFKKNIDFTNTYFSKRTDFRGVVCNKSANFIGANFNNYAGFGGASFDGVADFRYSIFNDNADFGDASFNYARFWGTNFSAGADFCIASFNNSVAFINARFNGYSDFGHANFSGGANFMLTSFSGHKLSAALIDELPKGIHSIYFRVDRNVDYVFTYFGGGTNFRGVKFGDDAIFKVVNFNNICDFSFAEFDSKVNFQNTNFNDITDFRNARFSGDADFTDARFNGDADFTDARFNGDADFTDARFNNIVSFSDNFAKVVYLNGIYFENMRVDWTSLEHNLFYDGPTYIKLIKNFREMEQFDDADNAYFKYRTLSQNNKKWLSVSWLSDEFMRISCGYGVKPQRTIVLCAVIILIFAIFNWKGKCIKQKEDHEEDGQKDGDVSISEALYFSMVTFVTLGWGDHRPIGLCRIYALLEAFVGWILLALFLVTLANVMIRP